MSNGLGKEEKGGRKEQFQVQEEKNSEKGRNKERERE